MGKHQFDKHVRISVRNNIQMYIINKIFVDR